MGGAGVGGSLFTDPQIHSTAGTYGDGNLGRRGIQRSFLSAPPLWLARCPPARLTACLALFVSCLPPGLPLYVCICLCVAVALSSPFFC